jgi:predicted dehydrogenase
MTDTNSDRKLRVGVLGCGPLAQAAHFEACVKARNAELFAICDVSEELLTRMTAAHRPQKTFADYEAMLADPEVDAVIIATSDDFHVPAATRALEAGKHVLCEKPLGVTVDEVEGLQGPSNGAGRILHVGL